MVKAMFENVVTTGQPVNRHMMILIWTLLSNFIIITLLMFNYQARLHQHTPSQTVTLRSF